jgi:hypothetical protein
MEWPVQGFRVEDCMALRALRNATISFGLVSKSKTSRKRKAS